MRPNRPRAAEGALVAVAAVWGLTFVMVQDAIRVLPSMEFLGYRFGAAAVLVAVVFRRRLAALSAAGWKAGALMGAFLTAGFVFQTLGLEATTASNAGFITGLFVVLTPLLGAIFLGERVARPAWAAAVVSACGLFLLSGASGLNVRGDGLELLCAVFFAAHILVTARAVRSHDVAALLPVQLAVCGAFCLAVAGADGELAPPTGTSVWSALLVTSLVASALGFYVQTYAQVHVSPTRTALFLASEPVFAGLFGYVLAGDRLPGLAWLGAMLIMAAILTVELVPRLRAGGLRAGARGSL